MAALSDVEHELVIHELNEKLRAEAWTQNTELLAGIFDRLGDLLARIEAGVAVVQVTKSEKPKPPPRAPRPEWIEDAAAEEGDPEEVVVGLKDLARMFTR